MKPRLPVGLACVLAVLASGCQSKQLVFTTFTKVGLNISATGQAPNNLLFGYKRFEGAIIPVDPRNSDTNGSPAMPSVFASVTVTNQWLRGLTIRQKFATGAAAENLSE